MVCESCSVTTVNAVNASDGGLQGAWPVVLMPLHRSCPHLCSRDNFRGSHMDNRSYMKRMEPALTHRAMLFDAAAQWSHNVTCFSDASTPAMPPQKLYGMYTCTMRCRFESPSFKDASLLQRAADNRPLGPSLRMYIMVYGSTSHLCMVDFKLQHSFRHSLPSDSPLQTSQEPIAQGELKVGMVNSVHALGPPHTPAICLTSHIHTWCAPEAYLPCTVL